MITVVIFVLGLLSAGGIYANSRRRQRKRLKEYLDRPFLSYDAYVEFIRLVEAEGKCCSLDSDKYQARLKFIVDTVRVAKWRLSATQVRQLPDALQFWESYRSKVFDLLRLDLLAAHDLAALTVADYERSIDKLIEKG